MSPNPDWRPYRCRECGRITSASALPPYCPVCDEPNVMEATIKTDAGRYIAISDCKAVHLDSEGKPRTGTEELSKHG